MGHVMLVKSTPFTGFFNAWDRHGSSQLLPPAVPFPPSFPQAQEAHLLGLPTRQNCASHTSNPGALPVPHPTAISPSNFNSLFKVSKKKKNLGSTLYCFRCCRTKKGGEGVLFPVQRPLSLPRTLHHTTNIKADAASSCPAWWGQNPTILGTPPTMFLLARHRKRRITPQNGTLRSLKLKRVKSTAKPLAEAGVILLSDFPSSRQRTSTLLPAA